MVVNNQATLTVEAPVDALDGSRRYLLRIVKGGGRVSGWIRVGDDGRSVYATIDRAAWQHVGTVAKPEELTPAWIAEHTEAILRPFEIFR